MDSFVKATVGHESRCELRDTYTLGPWCRQYTSNFLTEPYSVHSPVLPPVIVLQCTGSSWIHTLASLLRVNFVVEWICPSSTRNASHHLLGIKALVEGVGCTRQASIWSHDTVHWLWDLYARAAGRSKMCADEHHTLRIFESRNQHQLRNPCFLVLNHSPVSWVLLGHATKCGDKHVGEIGIPAHQVGVLEAVCNHVSFAA